MEIESRAKIRWACRRGMLELDLMLLPYFDKHFNTLNMRYKQSFTEILRLEDPQLLACLLGEKCPDNDDHRHIFDDIRQKTMGV